jgi:hypothetical protein
MSRASISRSPIGAAIAKPQQRTDVYDRIDTEDRPTPRANVEVEKAVEAEVNRRHGHDGGRPHDDEQRRCGGAC